MDSSGSRAGTMTTTYVSAPRVGLSPTSATSTMTCPTADSYALNSASSDGTSSTDS